MLDQRSRIAILLGCIVSLLLLSAPARADHAIVVLGAGVADDGTPSPILQRRLEAARTLAAREPGALLIVTGGAVTSTAAEGPAMAKWLRARGIDSARIAVESRARHTGENADFVAPILAREKISRITVVTSESHVARSLFHFRSALRERGMRRRISIRAHGVAEGLRGLERLRRTLVERSKILRDARHRALRRWQRSRTRSAPSRRRALRPARVGR